MRLGCPLSIPKGFTAAVGEGLSLLVNHPSLRDLPFLLETPKDLDGRPDADRVNLDLVRSWRDDG
jgi:hypothetical protein